MLLIRMTLTTLVLSILAPLAQAGQPIPQLEEGFYARTDGVAHLCRPFEVHAGTASHKSITISYIYTFDTENSTKRVPSDLDPDCEFVETNTRETDTDRTVLTRQNVEICDGNVKSDITTRLTIRHGSMRLDLEDKNDPAGYSCDWVKDTAARREKKN